MPRKVNYELDYNEDYDYEEDYDDDNYDYEESDDRYQQLEPKTKTVTKVDVHDNPSASGGSKRDNKTVAPSIKIADLDVPSSNDLVSKNGMASSIAIVCDFESSTVSSKVAKKTSTLVSAKKEVEDARTQLSLAIVGHVDSGKSTLSGRLLHLLKRISKKEMHKNEKEAKSQGKGSFEYAFVMDESTEERERGVTMNVAVAYFDSTNFRVVLLDSPGHKDFVPNMISGATQADAAVLVVDASHGAFEAGMNGGQTKEHAQLIRSFGVKQIVVAVNKMDVVDYSQCRFDEIKQTLGTFLRCSCGYKESMVSWVPLSAMENQNLVSAPSDERLSSWHSGAYLLEAIDSLQAPNRESDDPLLMPICDVIKSSKGQVSACGKVQSGALQSGLKVRILPSGELGTVKSLERDGSQSCSVANAGDNVVVTLHGIDDMMAGGVLCDPDVQVAYVKHLELKVQLLEGARPLLVGSQLEFHVHHVEEAARVEKIVSLLDPKSRKVAKKSPRCVVAKQLAVLEVVLQRAVCVGEYSKCKALGSVSLRASGNTVAVGTVNRIITEQEQEH